MGYMGFGSLSWVYKMKPRKPFSVERKSSFTAVSNYKREFKLQHSKSSSKKVALISLIMILIITPISFSMINDFMKHSKTTSIAKQKLENREDKIAYNFLLESGINRMYSKNYKGAYAEFKLAYQLNSNNEQLNNLMIETLSVLCTSDEKYCNDFDAFLMKVNLEQP